MRSETSSQRTSCFTVTGKDPSYRLMIYPSIYPFGCMLAVVSTDTCFKPLLPIKDVNFYQKGLRVMGKLNARKGT